MARGLSHIRL